MSNRLTPWGGGGWQRGGGGVTKGHEATDNGLAYAPVSQAHGHNHIVQCFSFTKGGGAKEGQVRRAHVQQCVVPLHFLVSRASDINNRICTCGPS